VLLGTHPRDARWAVGEQVTTRLRWLDDPPVPAGLRTAVRATPLPDVDGRPWAQLVRAGDLVALREGDVRGGDLVLSGCLGVDAYLGLVGGLPVTAGVVRRVRVVHHRHDRGAAGWVRRPGHVRLTDVPDADPGRLRDDPSLVGGGKSPGGPLQFLSAEEYFRRAYDRLPARQWQAEGFLVDLDVAGPA
jgi:hypothetical protein